MTPKELVYSKQPSAIARQVEHQASSNRKVADTRFVHKLAIRRRVLGKDSLRLFSTVTMLGSSSLPVLVTQTDAKLAHRIQQRC